MKIVVLDGYALNPGDLSWDAVKDLGDLKVYDRTPPDEILARASGAEILLTNKTPIREQAIRQLPQLKYIGVLATGYNIIDVDAASRNNIVVANIPDYGSYSVAQLTFALLLELCHHVQRHSDSVREGKWASSMDWCYWNYPLVELAGKTMGIIGFGNIGQKVGDMAASFGMSVLGEIRKPVPEIYRSRTPFPKKNRYSYPLVLKVRWRGFTLCQITAKTVRCKVTQNHFNKPQPGIRLILNVFLLCLC